MRHPPSHTFWENAQLMIAIIDSEGHYVYANHCYCCHLGRSKEEMYTSHVCDFDPNLTKENLVHYLKQLRQIKKAKLQTTRLKKDGTVLPVELTLSYIKEDDKEYILSIGSQSPHQKTLEEELEKTQALLYETINSPRNIVIISLDKDLRYRAFNGTHAKLMKLAWNAEIQPGDSFLEKIADPEQREKTRAQLERALGHERFSVTETYGSPASPIHFQVEFNPIYDKNEGLAGVTIVAMDITEQKRLIEELKEANHELEQFTYVATHDIKAPITNIENFLGLLQKDTKITQPRSVEALHWIKKSLEQCQKTIQNLIWVTQARKNEKLPLDKISLHNLLKESLQSFAAELNTHDILIENHVPEDCHIFFPEVQAISILHNLLSNAIKYRNPSRSCKITFEAKDTAVYTLFSIKDNGTGFQTEKDEEKVFGLFKRAHSKAIEGSGLGLYMVKMALEKHGGKIEAKGEPDQGATFTLYFLKEPFAYQSHHKMGTA